MDHRSAEKIDARLIAAATEVVQAQERLLLLAKRERSTQTTATPASEDEGGKKADKKADHGCDEGESGGSHKEPLSSSLSPTVHNVEGLVTDVSNELWRMKMLLEGSAPSPISRFITEGKTKGKLVNPDELVSSIHRFSSDFLKTVESFVLRHNPSTIPSENGEFIAQLVRDEFSKLSMTVQYVGLECCPWFALSQNDPQAGARLNRLIVIFEPSSEIFSYQRPEMRKVLDSFDEGVIDARDTSWFFRELNLGRTRCIEALYAPPSSVLYASDSWTHLLSSLVLTPFSSGEPWFGDKFVESCKGQTVGLVYKRDKKSKQLVMKQDVEIEGYCLALRLMDQTLRILHDTPILVWEDFKTYLQSHGGKVDGIEGYKPFSSEEASLLVDPDYRLRRIAEVFACKESSEICSQLFQIVAEMKKLVEGVAQKKKSALSATNSKWKQRQEIMQKWLFETRLDILKLRPHFENPSIMDPSDVSRVSELLTLLGPPAANLKPQQILCIAKTGSCMYGLSVSSSDNDYTVVYSDPTRDLLSTWKLTSTETFSNSGNKYDIEHKAQEARLFCELVIKGNHSIIEMLFKGESEYESPLWKELKSKNRCFISEIVIRQYLGFVKEHLWRVTCGKYPLEKDNKNFYHVFHKLGELERLASGQPLAIKISGEERDFILQVRQEQLTPLSKRALVALASSRLQALETSLAQRTWRYREVGDHEVLNAWLDKLRVSPHCIF